ncbi:MAG: proton-conducting transporter membrane subunit [Clostridia bacterium]
MMQSWTMLASIAIPMLCALPLCCKCMQRVKLRNAYVLCTVLVTSVLSLLNIAFPSGDSLSLIELTDGLTLALRVDGLSRVYGAIVAVLWPATTLYALDYMKHEQHLSRFYAFFLISYGVAMGIAFAANIVTLYLFFELLTLATLPLVMHKMDDEARYAGKRYLIYSMTGAALGFIAIAFLVRYGLPLDFTIGGVLDVSKIAGHETGLRVAYTLAFFGFGVKAALLPMSFWLPTVSVAPTPVTALLHAVAVVKAGAFACMRLTYYCFGTTLIAGTVAQHTILLATALTIIMGSFLALRNRHLKRRLAWSTVANLSYILFGTALMTNAGLLAACQHMVYHAFIKITLFFAVGAMMTKAKKSYLDEIEGLAKRMPVTFACFAVASFALIGIPSLPGFFSKWALGTAAVATGTTLGFIGTGALMISAVLTALYLVTILIRAYFPENCVLVVDGPVYETKAMNGVLIFCVAVIVLLGLFSGGVQTTLMNWLMGGMVL